MSEAAPRPTLLGYSTPTIPEITFEIVYFRCIIPACTALIGANFAQEGAKRLYLVGLCQQIH